MFSQQPALQVVAWSKKQHRDNYISRDLITQRPWRWPTKSRAEPDRNDSMHLEVHALIWRLFLLDSSIPAHQNGTVVSLISRCIASFMLVEDRALIEVFVACWEFNWWWLCDQALPTRRNSHSSFWGALFLRLSRANEVNAKCRLFRLWRVARRDTSNIHLDLRRMQTMEGRILRIKLLSEVSHLVVFYTGKKFPHIRCMMPVYYRKIAFDDYQYWWPWC